MDPNFTVSSDFLRANNVTLGGNETSVALQIEADCNWKITEDVDWLSVSPVEGNGSQSVTLTTGINPSAIDERSCQLTVTSDDGVLRTLTLRQSKATETLDVSPATFSFGEEGGLNSFTITSNTSWAISGGAEWLSYSTADGSTNGNGNASVSLNVATNNTEYSREAVLTITSSGGDKREVKVTQAEKAVSLTIQPSVINATTIANDYTFKIEGNATWTITVDDNTWLTYTPNEGTGPATVVVSVTDNTTSSVRTNKLTVTSVSGRITLPCTITQAAATPPTVTAVVVSEKGRYTAAFASSFSSPLAVTDYGFVWGTSPNPTIDNCTGHMGKGGEGFSFTDTGHSGKADVLTAGDIAYKTTTLASGVKYYVRAYATNANGIGYSPDVTFETSGNIPGDDDNPSPNL
jgi:hypothetical protein